mgnify:CR=1 FL=1
MNLEENKSLFTHWSGTYDWAPFQFWMRRFQLPVLREVDFAGGGKLLDVGCGTGELLKALEHKDKEHRLMLSGVDLSPEMLAKAQKKLSSSVTLAEGDVHQLSFREGTFDYVASTEAFHHYGDQSWALGEMKRVVKKEGKIIVVDINFFLRLIHRLFERFEPGCQKVNSRKEMRALFEQAGLQEIRQERSFLFAVMTVGRK